MRIVAIILTLLCLLSNLSSAGSVYLNPADSFIIKLNSSAGHNVWFLFSNMSLNYVHFSPDYIILNSTFLSGVCVQQVNLTVYDIRTTNKTFRSTGTLNWSVGGFNNNVNILVFKDGIYDSSLTTNLSGFIIYNSTLPGNYTFFEGTTTTTTTSTTVTTLPSGGGGGGSFPGGFVLDLLLRNVTSAKDSISFDVILKNLGTGSGDIKIAYYANGFLKEEQLFVHTLSQCALVSCPHHVVLSSTNICSAKGQLTARVFDVDTNETYATATETVCEQGMLALVTGYIPLSGTIINYTGRYYIPIAVILILLTLYFVNRWRKRKVIVTLEQRRERL